MAKISQDAISQILTALELYENEVSNTPLTTQSKRTYLLHAHNFVRWLQDDFEPGASLIERDRQMQRGLGAIREALGDR